MISSKPQYSDIIPIELTRSDCLTLIGFLRADIHDAKEVGMEYGTLEIIKKKISDSLSKFDEQLPKGDLIG